jgi:hypothetical protein
MNPPAENFIARLKKIATFSQRDTYYMLVLTPAQAEELVALIAAGEKKNVRPE